MPSSPKPILAKSRVFDYLEKTGLEKITDVHASEWHICILKELIDNALDADESSGLVPEIEIEIFYDTNGTLAVSVSNRATFPLEATSKIFTLDTYASEKDFLNGVTRGQQGNGLKTLLGIPYALHHFATGNYDYKTFPVSIDAGKQRRNVWVKVDSDGEVTHCVRPAKSPQEVAGTKIWIRAGGFFPDPPLSTSELEVLAHKYAVFNPFASFRWRLPDNGKEENNTLRFSPSRGPRMFPSVSPASWYRFDQFSKLVKSLVREGIDDLAQLVAVFIQPEESATIRNIVARLTRAGVIVSKDLLADDLLEQLYQLLIRHTSGSSHACIDRLGEESVNQVAGQTLKVEGQVVYGCRTEMSGDTSPYHLEVFMLRSSMIQNREIWAAVNFTPLYKDPFYRKQFKIEDDSQAEQIRGLGPLLDRFGVSKEDNVLVCVHLVSPNVDFQSYGKAEFDSAFIERSFVESIRQLCDRFNVVNRIRPHENELLKTITEAAEIVSSDGRYRYSIPQLYRKSKQLAFKAEKDRTHLAEDGLDRFSQVLIPEYQKQHGRLNGMIASRKSKFLAPSRPFQTVFWILKEGLEDLFLKNDLLNEFEAAIYWGHADGRSMLINLSDHLDQNRRYSIVAIHDGDAKSFRQVVSAMRNFAKAADDRFRFVDLGLSPANAQELEIPHEICRNVEDSIAKDLENAPSAFVSPENIDLLVHQRRRYDLDELPVADLITWIRSRLQEVGIVETAVLSDDEIRDVLRRELLQLSQLQIEKRVRDELRIEETVQQLSGRLESELFKMDDAVIDRLKSAPQSEWKMVLEDFVTDLVQNRFNASDMRQQEPPRDDGTAGNG